MRFPVAVRGLREIWATLLRAAFAVGTLPKGCNATLRPDFHGRKWQVGKSWTPDQMPARGLVVVSQQPRKKDGGAAEAVVPRIVAVGRGQYDGATNAGETTKWPSASIRERRGRSLRFHWDSTLPDRGEQGLPTGV